MGSLTLYELAIRGLRVIGCDRFDPPHTFGSSHGHSRIIREAYFEDPLYVPLVQRAYQRWHQLEQASGTVLFQQTGGLMLGPPDGMLVHGALTSADTHRLPYEMLTAAMVRDRFPAFHPRPDMVGLLEPRAGVLHPEHAIRAALTVATAHSAQVRPNETVLEWQPDGEGVTVVTTGGTYAARSLVLTVGAWTSELAAELRLPLVVQRNVQHWFSPLRHAEYFHPARFPVFIGEYAPAQSFYGFPELGDGLKIARHSQGDIVTAETVNRDVHHDEVAEVRALIDRFLPDASGPWRRSAVCLYTKTPDEHFLIGRHPGHAAVIVASPCSGHGFKFASAIGEALADLATNRAPQVNLATFAIGRFGTKSPPGGPS